MLAERTINIQYHNAVTGSVVDYEYGIYCEQFLTSLLSSSTDRRTLSFFMRLQMK